MGKGPHSRQNMSFLDRKITNTWCEEHLRSHSGPFISESQESVCKSRSGSLSARSRNGTNSATTPRPDWNGSNRIYDEESDRRSASLKRSVSTLGPSTTVSSTRGFAKQLRQPATVQNKQKTRQRSGLDSIINSALLRGTEQATAESPSWDRNHHVTNKPKAHGGVVFRGSGVKANRIFQQSVERSKTQDIFMAESGSKSQLKKSTDTMFLLRYLAICVAHSSRLCVSHNS